MVPRITRGSSHTGIGKYMLHDIDASSDARVINTYCVNVPTNDPEQALRHMAFTAIHAEDLKRSVEGSMSGRKSTGKTVYAYSLSWHPEEKPTWEHMREMGLETLGVLGLSSHEALIIEHNDTPHKHIHVVTSLVHPETGKMASVSYDRLKLSQWAEAYEKEHSKQVYCGQRVGNNLKRQEQAKENRQLALVKYREEKHAQAEIIQQAYQQSDSGKAFQAALLEHNLTLAQGDRRGFTLVDERGKVMSLSRNLKGQRAADIKARLGDIELPNATELSRQRQSFDRDQYETERQKKIVDAAIEVEEQRQRASDLSLQESTDIKNRKKTIEPVGNQKPAPSDSRQFLEALDKKRAAEQKASFRRDQLKAEQDTFYKRDVTAERVRLLEQHLQKSGNNQGTALELELSQLKKNLANIDLRIKEQQGALEKEIRLDQGVNDAPQGPDKNDENRIKLLREQWQKQYDTQRNRDQDMELGL